MALQYRHCRYRIEQTVLKQLRVQGHAPFLTAGQMPAGGWTETFDATLVTVEQLSTAVTCALTQPPA